VTPRPIDAPRRPADPLGYHLAALIALISGCAVFINGIGVRMFADSTLYTTLKNGVVGIVVVLPLLMTPRHREEVTRLRWRQWGLLLAIALLAGSAAYGLDFRGPPDQHGPDRSVIGHAQFLVVALLAAALLGERPGAAVLSAIAMLAGGLALGLRLGAVRMDAGVPLLASSTLLFAVGAVMIKAALGTISVAVVVAVKMTVGTALLFGYVTVTGRLSAVPQLSPLEWAFVLATGLILLAFTLTELWGLRHASATGVMAISAGAPVVTTLLDAVTRRASVPPLHLLSVALALSAVLVIYAAGSARETRVLADGTASPVRRRPARATPGQAHTV
jgi:drug/metabolite transporter (DMT)-like permease